MHVSGSRTAATRKTEDSTASTMGPTTITTSGILTRPLPRAAGSGAGWKRLRRAGARRGGGRQAGAAQGRRCACDGLQAVGEWSETADESRFFCANARGDTVC